MKKILKVAEGLFINTILITLLVCSGVYAAEETLPAPEEIITKNIEAIGGIKALNKIKNKKIVTIHKIVQRNMEVKDVIYQERPNNFYFSDESTPERATWGYNGKMVWHKNPHSGARILEGDEASNYLPSTIFDGPDGPDARYKSMKTEGVEQINGKDCYKVVKTLETGPERTVYYDKKSFMIVKITSHSTEEYFEEYQKINGILFPYKEIIFLNGQKYLEITTDKIELNIKMPEGIFDIPKEIKAIMNKNETEPHAQQ
ncbi:hypothetical protein ACFL1N_13475 [Thermodesulfobacteriota bacterium]